MVSAELSSIMAAHSRPRAILHSGLVRLPEREVLEPSEDGQDGRSGWTEDLSLFGVTWLTGFVFFLAYLS
jgi:hypothetical protein